jgi:hypothetical protein
MKLKKVISGGQTGADRTGLEEAKALGIETGGFAPRGYRTEEGNDPSLKEFGLVETASNDYPTRTKLNAESAPVTVWFGNTNSSGFRCTDKFAKFMCVNPSPEKFRELCDLYEVINIAGNRKSKNPEVCNQVRAAFAALSLDKWAYGSGPDTLAGNDDL